MPHRAPPPPPGTPGEGAQSVRLEGPTLTEGVAWFEAQGFRGQFGARPGGRVVCFTCRQESPAREVAVRELLRVEGASDPGSMAAVAAVICPRCGALGTLVLSYGPEASPEDGEVLRLLEDARAEPSQR